MNNLEKKNGFTIRLATQNDLEALMNFFILAYGIHTIFQNDKFLMYFFNNNINSKSVFKNSLIAINENGEIVSHYGGINYNLRINNEIKNIIWGVNAVTLPEYSGKGINSNIVDYIMNNNDINGVIGFTKKTARFYKDRSYNVFNYEKFTRHIFVLDHKKTKEVCDFINQDFEILNKNMVNQRGNTFSNNFLFINELNLENLQKYSLNLYNDFSDVLTTDRSKDLLYWRFLKNPFMKYQLLGVVKNEKIVAYAAFREEVLHPLNFEIIRIIDLFGNRKEINGLLEKIKEIATLKKKVYIDFSKMGIIYNEELKNSGFNDLKNEECCVLPQVTSPIENRLNFEYLGLQSNSYFSQISNLSIRNIYFTRIDSDRDRIANINQLKKTIHD